jgi:hypothetical protein
MHVRDTDKFSQATNRSYRVFRDQHGRKWGADIENKTQAPCGPYSARFQAPWCPDQKYILLTDPSSAEITIDYDRMEMDFEQAATDFEYKQLAEARRLYKDRALQAIQEKDEALEMVVGTAPMSADVVRAARAGNPWLLGLRKPDGSPFPMPEEARVHFPEPDAGKKKRAIWGGTPTEPVATLDNGFPKHKGGGNWDLSNGTTLGPNVRKEEALKREREVQAMADEPQPVAAGVVDDSWRV